MKRFFRPLLGVIVAGIVLPATVTLGFLAFQNSQIRAESRAKNSVKLPVFTKNDLLQYNGTDPHKPVYLALDGYVYDVSQGRKYYEINGPYHSLAGRDASFELHIAGEGIIKKKYSVIGILR
ncbi:MAG: cytochrome b5 domain-containing protein [Patescibacteria group bacterium]|jgi:predicted heme/steroid binding protein